MSKILDDSINMLYIDQEVIKDLVAALREGLKLPMEDDDGWPNAYTHWRIHAAYAIMKAEDLLSGSTN